MTKRYLPGKKALYVSIAQGQRDDPPLEAALAAGSSTEMLYEFAISCPSIFEER